MAYYTQGQGLISQRRGNASYFYHYDGLGSTKALTDANQNIQGSYKYDAWGNILQTSGTITNPYLYVGELGYYSDGDSGMYILTQRWYNSVLARFVVRDPLGRVIRSRKGAGSAVYPDAAPYMYGANNPVNTVDPEGAASWQEVVGLPFGVIGGYGMVFGFLVADCGFPIDWHLHWRPKFIECACLELKEAYKDLRCMGQPGPLPAALVTVPIGIVEALYDFMSCDMLYGELTK